MYVRFWCQAHHVTAGVGCPPPLKVERLGTLSARNRASDAIGPISSATATGAPGADGSHLLDGGATQKVPGSAHPPVSFRACSAADDHPATGREGPALLLRLDLPVRLMSGHAVRLHPRRRRRGDRHPPPHPRRRTQNASQPRPARTAAMPPKITKSGQESPTAQGNGPPPTRHWSRGPAGTSAKTPMSLKVRWRAFGLQWRGTQEPGPTGTGRVLAAGLRTSGGSAGRTPTIASSRAGRAAPHPRRGVHDRGPRGPTRSPDLPPAPLLPLRQETLSPSKEWADSLP